MGFLLIKTVGRFLFLGLLLATCMGEHKPSDSKNIQHKNRLHVENVWQALPHQDVMIQDDKTNEKSHSYDPLWLLHDIDLDKFNVLIDGNYNVSITCVKDVLTLVQDLLLGGQYAINVFDSIGKPGAGVLYGNFKWMGSFEECQDAKKIENGNVTFQGQYCLAGIQTSAQPAPDAAGAAFQGLNVGICVPNTCNQKDTLGLINSALSVLGPVTQNWTTAASVCATGKDLTTGAIISIAVLCLVALLGLLGTTLDVVLWYRSKSQTSGPSKTVNSPVGVVEDLAGASLIDNDTLNEDAETDIKAQLSTRKQEVNKDGPKSKLGMFGQFLLAFSWWTNGAKLLSTKQTAGTLGCVHGIRFLSMSWVILGHSVAFIIMYLDNIVYAADVLTKRFTFQAVENATFSVDSFFFLSGLLVTFLTIKHLRNNSGKMNWAMFYFHRFLRLTPTYMLVIMFFTTLTVYLPRGPLQRALDESPALSACNKYWWTNLLYINNFIPGDLNGQCMGWGWFLANDMQFHIISPVILYLLYRWKKAGLLTIGLLCVVNFIITGVLARRWKVIPGPAQFATNDVEFTKHSNYIYQRFYHRMASYLVGMATGFLLVECDCRAKFHKLLVMAGWAAAVAINMSVLYGIYHYNSTGTNINVDLGAFYTAVSRCAWCVGLGWLTFACVTGNGGPVNAILSWSVFIPLGRLTYCAYLVHPIVIFVYFLSMKIPFHYSDFNMIYIFVGNMFLSYAVAFVVSLAVEAPMLSLEKLIFRREKREPEPAILPQTSHANQNSV